jgi:hypothetical protein
MSDADLLTVTFPKRIAVVNRGEAAVRLIRAVRELNAEHGCAQKVQRSQARGTVYPYELIPLLTGSEGSFVEYDFDESGEFVPVDRPYGRMSLPENASRAARRLRTRGAATFATSRTTIRPATSPPSATSSPQAPTKTARRRSTFAR